MQLGHQIARLAGKILKPIRAGKRKLAIEKSAARLEVTSSSFPEGGAIPAANAGKQGRAPALSWTGVPEATQEIVVLCEDPDAPFPKPVVHWTVLGIPPTTTGLDAGMERESPVPGGGTQAKNSTGKVGYTGPNPPPGHGVHHYHFEVFALGAPLGLTRDADRDDVVAAMKGKVLASGETVGTFEAR